MITQTIKLNLIPGGILPRIKASQYDSGARTLVFKLYNGVQEFTIPTDSTVSIRGTKSDHTGFQYECEYSGSEVTAKITDQMTVSPGEVLAELVITKDDERIATGNFIFDNERAALDEDTPISHTEIPWIERIDDLVVLVEEDTAKAEDAADRAENALSEIEDYAERAAASASQASTSATNAASSASAASTSESNATTSETNAQASATQAESSAAAALASQQAAAQSATNAAASESNAVTSEINAGNSATAASESATAAAESEANAADSETAAAGSAANAASLASQAAGSAANAAISESNAASSETNAGNSATQAESSAQTASTAAANASTSASSASTSAANAANSETLARKWAVGDSGSGSNVPSDTNNAYYWAQVAQRAAGGGLTIEVVAALPTTDISVTKIYLVPSSDPKSQNVKDEYVNLDGTTSGWELIGSTAVDLSGYYTKAQVDVLIQGVKDYADGKVAELKGYVQENYTPTTLLKDTVGWTGKNLIPYPYTETTNTSAGITWTDNGDGTITANGTAASTTDFNLSVLESNDFSGYVLNGCPDGGSANGYFLRARVTLKADDSFVSQSVDIGEGCMIPDILSTQKIYLRITIRTGQTVSNLTFYPMLRRADIVDDTWEPYHESVEEVVESKLGDDYANVYGAKNLLPYPYYETTKTVNGITFTDNGDGTITANGTATNNATFLAHTRLQAEKNDFIIKNGRYILSGCPADGGYYIYYINLTITKNNNVKILATDIGDGEVFTISGDDYSDVETNLGVQIVVAKNQTVSNLTFHPMIRLASIKDDTWVPYAKTNKELTEDVKNMSGNSGNANMGQGYGTCSTAESTTAKVATLADYVLTKNGVVAVRFTNAVPASSTLNINSNGAKPIYYKGSAIPSDIIRAGDTATFFYDGSYYHLTSVDRQMEFNFATHAAMNAAITAGTVPNGAICHTDKTDYEVVDGVAKPIIKHGVNLLDNWYFVGGGSQQGGGRFPINQRNGYIVLPTSIKSDSLFWGIEEEVGVTSGGTINEYNKVVGFGTNSSGIEYAVYNINGTNLYTLKSTVVPGYTGAGYGIDRWKASNNYGAVKINNSGLNLIGFENSFRIVQNSEQSDFLNGKTGTFSALMANGSLYSKTFTIGNVLGGHPMSNNCYWFSTLDTLLILDVNANSEETIQAMKLELGSKQTLAHQDANGNWVLNEIPNFQQELAKCQRYYYKTQNDRGNEHSGIADTHNIMRGNVTFPVTMRTAPAVKLFKNTPGDNLIENVSYTYMDIYPISPNGFGYMYFPDESNMFTVGRGYGFNIEADANL